MRNLKKVLVLVLSLAMMLSIMVVGAGAFTDSDKIDAKHQEAVEIATQLKIINGYPDGSFQPEGHITRAEMSKIICVALNGGEAPATAVKAEPSFKDIQGNWAEGYIEYCFAKGIVAGKSETTFDPNGDVTGAEAAKMLLVALGYNADVEKYVGPDWDLYVNVQANQDGLYVDLLDIETKDPLTREHAAQMIWNALQAFTVQKTSSVDRSDGTVTDNYAKTETTLFWETYRGYQGSAQMVGFEYDKDASEWTYYLDIAYDYMDQQVGRQQNTNNQAAATAEFTSDKDYTALLGHDVEAIFNIDARNATYKANIGTVYGIFNDSSKEIVKDVCFGDIAKMTDKNMNNDTIKIGDNTYRLEGGLTFRTIPVYEFRSEVDITATQAFANGAAGTTTLEDVIGSDSYAGNWVIGGINVPVNGQITCYDPQKFIAVDEDGNDKIDFLITTPFSFLKVESLNGTKVQLFGAFVDNIIPNTFFIETSGTKRWLSDEVSMYDGLAKGDYVKYTDAANTATDVDLLEKPDSVFSGTISKADGSDVTVDSTDYTIAPAEVYTGKGTVSAASTKGNVLTDAQVINGYIFRVEGLKRVTFDDFAIVTAASGGVGINGPQAKLLFTNGETKTVDTDRSYAGWVGQLVEWYVRDGDYYLTMVNNLDYADDVYSMSDVVANVSRISNSNSKIGNIADRSNQWADINDDAVVFVKYLKDTADPNSVAYKSISGKQLKANPVANFNNVVSYKGNNVIAATIVVPANPVAADLVTYPNTMVLAYADSPSLTNNKNHAEFAYIDLTANGVITSKDYYGYVTGTGTDEVTGYKTLDLWTADGAKTVTYSDDNILAYDSRGNWSVDPQDDVIEAGMAIRYKTSADENVVTEILGYYNMETEVQGTRSFRSDNGTDAFWASTIAITNLPSSDPNDKFEFVEYNMNAQNKMIPNWNATVFAPDGTHFFDIDDADILYVDIDSDTPYTDQALDTASRNTAGDYVSNAMVVYEADGTVDLLVYFVDGE